jgi:hypothetical protein
VEEEKSSFIKEPTLKEDVHESFQKLNISGQENQQSFYQEDYQ